MKAQVLMLIEQAEGREDVSDSMKRHGHEVWVAASFDCAKRLLKGNHFDLIISEVHLQNGGSVFDFLRWIRTDASTASIPFVCFSSHPTETAKYMSDGVRTAARMLGATKYISMDSFDADKFCSEVEQLLSTDCQPE